MSADTSPPPHITVDEEGDLTLRPYAFYRNESFTSSNGKESIQGRILATFKVSRQVLLENSPVFKAQFTNPIWVESHLSTVDLPVDKLDGIEVALRVMHKTLVDGTYKMNAGHIWGAIVWCENRCIEVSTLRECFRTWWGRQDVKKLDPEEKRKLLYPAYILNHARAFAFLTKTLAYEMADHITEINPTDDRSLHLDGNAIGSVNGARGSLRSKMLRELFDPVSDFLGMKCGCKAESLFAYCMGLSKTGIWPLHDHYKKSVQEVLDGPGFQNFKCTIADDACIKCRSKMTTLAISTIRHKLLNDFDGLCLDCMEMTKFGNVDDDYWRHDWHKAWDEDCRISHGQPTWYFSFMGRKTDMKNHQNEKKVRYKQRQWDRENYLHLAAMRL